MAFLRIDGFAVDALVDDYQLEDATIESYGRTPLGDTLEGVTYSPKKSIRFRTPPLTPQDAQALEGWVRGDGHRWSFARRRVLSAGATTVFTRASEDAGYSFSGASIYGSTVSTLWGNQVFSLAVVSSGTTSATVAFGSEGNWTVHGYHLASGDGPWRSFAGRSYAGTVQWTINGASVGSVPFLSVTAASGVLGARLAGRTSAGVSATAQFAAVSIDRFGWSDDMLVSAASVGWGLASTGYTRRPFVVVTGDGLQSRAVPCNGAGEVGPWVAKGFAETFDVQPVTLDGVFRYNARSLSVRLEEK